MKLSLMFILFFIGMGYSNIINDFLDIFRADIKQTIHPDYSWISISFLAILVMLMVGAVGYMLGAMFGEKVKAYSKKLIADGIVNAILILIISVLFLFYNSTTLSNLYITQMLHLEGSINYIKTIRNSLLTNFAMMSVITGAVSYIGNMAPYLKPGGIIGVSFSIAPAFRPFFDIVGVLLSAIASANGVWYAQLWFLSFVQNKMFALFMPIGLFLRATKFEGIGNTLIALCLGFFFIYPLILNLGFTMFERYMSLNYGIDYYVEAEDGQKFRTIVECVKYQTETLKKQNKYVECTITAGFSAIKVIGEELASMYKDLINPLAWITYFITASVVVTGIIFTILHILVVFIKITIEYVVLMTLILPAVSIFLTFLAIDEISKFLGTEIDLSAFEKIF